MIHFLVWFILLVPTSFAAGWYVHRRSTFWAKVYVTGVLEQWIEEQCGHLLGTQSVEELDSIMDGIMRPHIAPTVRAAIRRRVRRKMEWDQQFPNLKQR